MAAIIMTVTLVVGYAQDPGHFLTHLLLATLSRLLPSSYFLNFFKLIVYPRTLFPYKFGLLLLASAYLNNNHIGSSNKIISSVLENLPCALSALTLSVFTTTPRHC